MKYGLVLLLCFCLQLAAFAQNGSIEGRITTSEGEPAGFVNVYLKEAGKGTASSENGNYTLKNVKPGNYTLITSLIGLQTQEKTVAVEPGKVTNLDFTLSESSQKLSEVQVIARRTQNDRPVAVGKMAVRPMDMPQSMAVVGTEVITEQQASKLSDVIKNVNGVALGTTRGTTSETFFARGYNLGANNIMKNGARSNSAVIPEASTLERVEVLKGSAALLYGNVSGGAVINMVTKQPKYEFGGEISMRAGSYNLYKPLVDIYGPISQKLAFRVIGTYETAGSYRKNIESERLYVNPSLLYKISNRTDILLQADYLKHDLTPDFGVGSLADTILNTKVGRSATFNTPWAYNNVAQTNASLSVNHQFNETWKLNFIAARQDFDRNYFSTERIQALANGNWGRKLTRSKIAEDYYNSQLNLNGAFKTGALEHTVLVGADAERYMNITNGFNVLGLRKGGVYDSINVFDPNRFEARTDLPETTNITRTETPTYRYGVFAQDLISISEKFKVLAGLRWSYQEAAQAKIYDLEKDTVTTGAKAKYDQAFSPRVGLVYQPSAATSVFASYSNNFTTNAGTDIYGNNLKPSIIDQYEVGVKNDLIKGRLSANVTIYRILNNDLAQMARFDKDGKENANANFKEFTGQTTSDGAEIDLNGTLLPGLNFLAGYSYNFMRYTKTPGNKGSYKEGERLVNNPAHTGNASLFYTFSTDKLKGLKVGVSGFYTGARNAGWNNTYGQTQQFSRLIKVDGFTTFDLTAGYTYKQISLLAKMSNITNELNYYVHENYSVNPIAPRQFVTTVSYKF
ncbi:TonB-dependent receptor [Adhaeribacter sp. BT258]|uniref:TonB-dependent receptor n=1 Tax=Adhaeribacter terrigena TaxID=2793070 RepID=A0ABS1C241_9BACT|nr:TonB-dependent receptor [Adhaeribacter terrigena]MBK0403388.1 TonB-dependent receptor [Adhaeribacter terrigena]